MAEQWYFVEGTQRRGPISQQALEQHILERKLGSQDFVWREGLASWQKVEDVPELYSLLERRPALENEIGLSSQTLDKIRQHEDFSTLSLSEKVFFIQVGADRDQTVNQYGPYSLNILVKLFQEKRISGKTQLWKEGMEEWRFLADLPLYSDLFAQRPPQITESERRLSSRKPFIARLFFHNEKSFFEGVCRDISVGGMQVLVADFPANVGEELSLNVHPENTDYHFVTKGKVVRVLEGKSGFSLRFLGLSDEARLAITKYIEQTSQTADMDFNEE